MRYNVIGYFLTEGFRNVFKNKKSTISCLGVMCATMLMFGAFFAIGKNITNMVENLEDAQAIQVFFTTDTPEEEIVALKDSILSIEGVASATRKTKQDAYNEIKESLDNPKVMDGMEPDFMEDSYVITLTNLELNNSVQEQLKKLPHYSTAYSSNETITTLAYLSKIIRAITGIILVILIFISTFIIANTIKLTVHARRKEISIMKYVGATDGFIRTPFMIEGIIIGMVSSIISLGLVGVIYNWCAIKVSQSETLRVVGFYMLNFKELLNGILIVYILLGVGIGIIGSRISMKKYLEV